MIFEKIRQRRSKLRNGKTVKYNDLLFYVDSDNFFRVGRVKKRKSNNIHQITGVVLKKGTLFFNNNTFKLTDYNLNLVRDRHERS